MCESSITQIEYIEIELLAKVTNDGRTTLMVPVKTVKIPLMAELPNIISFNQKFFVQNQRGQYEEAFLFIVDDRQ